MFFELPLKGDRSYETTFYDSHNPFSANNINRLHTVRYNIKRTGHAMISFTETTTLNLQDTRAVETMIEELEAARR